MVKCADCGKEIPDDHIVYCDMCEAPLCEESGNLGLCSTCAELWEAETDIEAMEAAAKPAKTQFRLTLNSAYDPSGPKRTVLFFSRMMKAVKDMRKKLI